MLQWSTSDFLKFPVLGDQIDVRFPLAGVDLDACKYVVQPGDSQRLGLLAFVLTGGQTAMSIALPPAGTAVDLAPSVCGFLRAALATLPIEHDSGAVGRAGAFEWIEDIGALEGAARLRGTLGALLPGSTGGVDRAGIAALVQSYVGHSKGSPQFEEVTQGRNSWAGYSACGDLWNFVLYRMGCRDPAIVNRNAPPELKWRVTENLSRPIAGAQAAGAWVPFKPGLVPQVGDLVLIGKYPNELEHALVHLGAQGSKWLSGDYGQVDASGQPSSKTVLRDQVGDKLGSRALIGWINIDKIPRQAGASLPGGSSKKSLLAELAAAAAIAAGVVFLW